MKNKFKNQKLNQNTEMMKWQEQKNEGVIDDLGGCRKGENMIKHKTRRSGGLVAWHTEDGKILLMTTILRTESPTWILQMMSDLLFNDEYLKQYFSRCAAAFGWDMMCNIMKRLLGQKMRSFLFHSEENEKPQSEEEIIKIFYIFITFGLHRLFIDFYHAQFHTRDECKCKDGVFHVSNKKFKEVFKVSNHNISEQFWVLINKLRNLKQLNSEKFMLAIFLRKEMHNNDLKEKLEKDDNNYWESCQNFKSKFDICWEAAKKWYDEALEYALNAEKNDIKVEYHVPTYEEFITNKLYTSTKIELTKRETFFEKIPDYTNFWANKGSEFKTNTHFIDLIKYLEKEPQIVTISKKFQNYIDNLSHIQDNLDKLKSTIEKCLKETITKICEDDDFLKKFQGKKYQKILQHNDNGMLEYIKWKTNKILNR